MTFDAKSYAHGIKRLNQKEAEQIRVRVQAARVEAGRLAMAIKNAATTDPGRQARIYLFGSLAEGEPARIDFDIDLALEGCDVYAAMDLAATSLFEVDLVDMDRLPASMRRRILDRGIPL